MSSGPLCSLGPNTGPCRNGGMRTCRGFLVGAAAVAVLLGACGGDQSTGDDETADAVSASASSDENEEIVTLGLAEVDGDVIDTTDFPADRVDQAEAIWGRFVELIPTERRQRVVGFELTNGQGGWAYTAGPNRDDWTVMVGEETDETELDQLLLRLYVHLLIRNNDETAPDGSPGCDNLLDADRCAREGSILLEFHTRFWPADLVEERESLGEEASQAYRRGDAQEDIDKLFTSFYEAHTDLFINERASLNVHNDIGESFLRFLDEERPTGDSIIEQKAAYFWDRPDLVELRDHIRSAEPDFPA